MNSHNPPVLPSTSSGSLSSTTSPTLPNEIIFNVLKRLAEDKPSLAKCMRVSSTFNEITGPILYTTIVLDGLGITPYYSTQWSPVQARLSQSPSNHIGLIKNIIILPHTSPDLVKGLIRRRDSVDTLRLPILDLNGPHVRRPLGVHSYLNPPPKYRCILVNSFNPKKLVVYDSRIHTEHNLVSANRSLHTLVFLISPTSSAYRNKSGSCPVSNHSGIKKIVHLVWLGDMLGTCAPHSPLENRDATIGGFMGYFSLGVRSSITDYPYLKDIVLVNGGQLHHTIIGMQENLSRQNRDAKFEKIVLNALGRLGKHKAKEQSGHYTLTYGARNINIVFVSLRKCFKTYDWAGEFTAEEARPWLESREEED